MRDLHQDEDTRDESPSQGRRVGSVGCGSAVPQAHEGGAPGDGGDAPAFELEQIVYEPKQTRVGKVVAIKTPAPVLYGIEAPNLYGKPWSWAYERDLKPATPAQAAEWRTWHASLPD
jgi:hypothetical protein